MSQFQLFPSPSNTKAPKNPKNPFRLENQRATHAPPIGSIPLNDLNGKGIGTEALLFQIVDDAKNIKAAKEAKTPRSTPVSIPETIQELRTPESLFSQSPKNKTANQWGSPAYKVSQASPTGVSNNNIATRLAQRASEASSSPVIPMKSIFPQYNPNVSLSQQQYYPQLSANTRTHRPKELSFTPPPEIDRALGPKTVPASVMNFPAGVLDQIEIQYSSITELKGLWEAANGQRPQDLAGKFNLRVAR